MKMQHLNLSPQQNVICRENTQLPENFGQQQYANNDNIPYRAPRRQDDQRFYMRRDENNNDNKRNDDKRKDLWCSFCRNNSHTDRTCRRKAKDDKANMVRNTDDNSGNDGMEHSFVFAVKGEDNVTPEASEMLVDSGASKHITFDEPKFTSFDKNFIPHKHTIELADGTQINSMATAKGTAVFYLRDEDGNLRKSYLRETLLIPSFPHEIFSVRAAARNHSSIHLYRDYGFLMSSNDTYFPIETIGDLYYLNGPKTGQRTPKRKLSDVTYPNTDF